MSQSKKPSLNNAKKPESLFQNKATEAAFKEWRNRNLEKLQAFERCPENSKTLVYALSEFWYERVNSAWHDAIELVKELRKIVAMKDGEARDALLAFALEAAEKLVVLEKQRSSLATGRKIGVEVRRKKAQTNNANLKKAIAELFDNPEKPGWNWTNLEIERFLAPKFAPTYSSSTVAQSVKSEAAKFRKERKLQQASKFPNR